MFQLNTQHSNSVTGKHIYSHSINASFSELNSCLSSLNTSRLSKSQLMCFIQGQIVCFTKHITPPDLCPRCDDFFTGEIYTLKSEETKILSKSSRNVPIKHTKLKQEIRHEIWILKLGQNPPNIPTQ